MNRMTALRAIEAVFLIAGTAAQAASVNSQEILQGELRRLKETETSVLFRVAPCASDTPAARTIPNATTPGALANLLDGYNYGAVWDERGKLMQVIVSGRIAGREPQCQATMPGHADGDSLPSSGPHPELLHYEPLPPVVPDRYRDRVPGSVRPVSLPTEELARMEPGDRLDLSLPDGRFGVILENRFTHENGDVTWVGRLEDEDSSDRVVITHGTGGSVGQVMTPDNTYDLEFEEGRSWLVDSGPGDWQGSMEE